MRDCFDMTLTRLHTKISCLLFAGTAVALFTAADDPKPPPARPWAPEPGRGQALKEAWPDHPEWVDMLTDILKGASSGRGTAGSGRPSRRPASTGTSTRKRFDRDGDGRIARKEFPGPDADFARLDRDHDGALTAADFDFSAQPLTPSPGAMLFFRADRDGNGKLTREELDGVLPGGRQRRPGLPVALRPPGAAPEPSRPSSSPSRRPAQARGREGPRRRRWSAACSGRRSARSSLVPPLGETAPDFTLKTIDGKQEVTLSKQIGPKPVVLVFGNFTCGPFRSQAGNVEKLYRRYKDRATFSWSTSAKPTRPTAGGWRATTASASRLAQPRTYDERVRVAQTCGDRLGLGFPLLVDTIDDTVGTRYSGMPGRLYLIDRDGKVAYKSGRAPSASSRRARAVARPAAPGQEPAAPAAAVPRSPATSRAPRPSRRGNRPDEPLRTSHADQARRTAASGSVLSSDRQNCWVPTQPR